MRDVRIGKLLAPRTLALFGGAWADAVEAASRQVGYRGEIWRVHPERASTPDRHYFRSAAELPDAPDASFLATPAPQISAIAAALEARQAGGFVCFASGFSEVDTTAGSRLTEELVRSAGAMPFFGPNCYGFVNFFDRTALWPDQVVGQPTERGVAIICQSGTLALNLLFNDRSVPLGYVLTVGNQTRIAIEDLVELLSEDDRVTAFGLYVEGIKDSARFAAAVEKARHAGKPIALVKAGRTQSAVRTARTHTGSLAGSDSVFDAFCRQAGVARCESLATLCETLKVLHSGGPLRGRRLLVMGASGGDMAMTSDTARGLGLQFPPLAAQTAKELGAILGDRVTLANPLDFHTHIWFDPAAMQAMFGVAQRADFDATAFMIDCPPATSADPSAYLAAIEAYIAASAGSSSRGAVISSLPESMAPATRTRCLAAGIVPLQGQREALEALDLAGALGERWLAGGELRLRLPPPAGDPGTAYSLSEADSKSALGSFGVRVPRFRVVPAAAAADAAREIGFPVVIKAMGLEHKSDHGAVELGVRTVDEAAAAAARLAGLSDVLIVEEMVTDGVTEILVGVSVDPQFGQVLLLGAGGVLAELLRDTVTLLPPFTSADLRAALGQLRVSALLRGYRGKPAGDIEALVATILGCARYAEAHTASLLELDLNPVIVRPQGRGAVAVDALIRLRRTLAPHGEE